MVLNVDLVFKIRVQMPFLDSPTSVHNHGPVILDAWVHGGFSGSEISLYCVVIDPHQHTLTAQQQPKVLESPVSSFGTDFPMFVMKVHKLHVSVSWY